MPFSRPSLPALVGKSASDIKTRVPGADPQLPRSFFAVLARTLANGLNGLYGSLDYTSKQVLDTDCDDDILLQRAAQFDLTQEPATKATGTGAATGTNGRPIPAGSVLQRSDQAQFITVGDVTISAGTATLQLQALVAGTAGNTPASSQLTFLNPIAGVAAVVTVGDGGLGAGNDIESVASVRARLLARRRSPPMGGKRDDYESWAKAVAGVTRVWIYPLHVGLGTVGITFVMDNRDDIIPLEADVDAVQAAIDANRNVTADAQVFAPTPIVQNYEIALTVDTAEIRAAVEASLADLWAREATPGGTPTVNNIPGGTIYRSHITQAISNATGEVDSQLIAPADDVVVGTGEMSILGTPTWS